MAAFAAMVVLTPSSAVAATASVSATPGTMPYVTSANATVRKMAQCGTTMYAVGTFSTVGTITGGTLTRNNAFSWNATTGVVTSWDPNTNGLVNSIAFSPDCSSAYLGGSFTTAKGVTATHLVKVNATTAAVDTTFHPAPNGQVYTVQQSGTHLIVGGAFTTIAGTSRRALASVNLTTGVIDPYVTLAIAGNLPNSTQRVDNFELSTGGTKLLVMGSFTTVAGIARQQIFMIDLGATTTTLDAWYSPDFSLACAASEPFYIQAAAWSPDDQSIYLAATGFKGASPICDAASKFTSAANSSLLPLWINKTGCDSLYSVAADDTYVYVGGHQRWLGNSGCNAAGPGAFARQGIGSLFATTGAVTPWNPTRARGHGADDLLLTSQGLWISSDTTANSVKCAGAYHPGICFFPH